MALLWMRQANGVRYEVRQAGDSLRLYTDGVLHTQYNPQREVTGSVWDLLSLPAVWVPPGQLQRVLVLGVGGGSALQQIARWVNPALLIGIELNPHHVYVAERFFGLKQPGIILYQADAIRWLHDYQGPPFDLIIDDLYGEENGEPVRAIALNQSWCDLLLSNLEEEGVLVTNTLSWQALNDTALTSRQGKAAALQSAFRLTTPHCYNAVGVFSRRHLKAAELTRQIANHPVLAKASQTGLLRYQLRRLRVAQRQ